VELNKEHFLVKGGKPLQGSLRIHGAKNAALPVMAACLLSPGTCRIENIPLLSDVLTMARIFEAVGCSSEFKDGVLTANCANLCSGVVPKFLMREIRSSIIVVGALLARQGYALVSRPGGCEIGRRNIDLHIKGLKALGAELEDKGGNLLFTAKRLIGSTIYLDYPSVGATENIMLAAVTAQGITYIDNAAREPEIIDLQVFLNRLGGRVTGAGTNQIRIDGVSKLGDAQHSIIPDRIVAGTMMVAAALTGGDVTLLDVVPGHLTVAAAKLREMGAQVEFNGDWVRVGSFALLEAVDKIRTAPHPGFPTDLQAQFMAALATAKGVSRIEEMVFESRYKHVDELLKMGANISAGKEIATIIGVSKLYGATVTATDLRAGAALVIAGLAAQGTTTVTQIHHIDRGYVALEDQLTALGADIRRVKGEPG
jgi:UDP-N-acetylglucosamine 1-carboxyvinyltransferase